MKKLILFFVFASAVLLTASCKKAVAPTVVTGDASNVQYQTATIEGEVTDNGGADITARGFFYGTSQDLTEGAAGVTKVDAGSGDGQFTANLSQLSPATTYYFKAWAVNEAGTTNGAVKSFTTLTK